MADDVLPTHWLLDYHDPQYDVMFTRDSDAPNGPRATRVWHKIVYKTPQYSDRGDYLSEIVLVEMVCAQQTVALGRDLKYTAQDALLSDTVIPQKQLVRIRYNDKRLPSGLSRVIQDIGLADDDDYCRTAD